MQGTLSRKVTILVTVEIGDIAQVPSRKLVSPSGVGRMNTSSCGGVLPSLTTVLLFLLPMFFYRSSHQRSRSARSVKACSGS